MAAIDVHREADTKVVAPEQWVAEVAKLEDKYCREIRRVDPVKAVSNISSGFSAGYQVIKPYLKRYENAKVLEVGSGYGFGLTYLRKLGINAFGVEPGNSTGFEGRHNQAKQLMEANGIENASQILFPAMGEALPFADSSFDIVYSLDVLEHVRNIEDCLREAYRVVKPGGIIMMVVPNYNSFREQHYDVFWLPHLLHNKAVARWYVRTFFGRKDWFIDELTFVTPKYFKNLVGNIPELQGMNFRVNIDPNIPFLSKFFSHVAARYYQFRSKKRVNLSAREKLSGGLTELLLNFGEFIGMAQVCFVIWDPAK